MDVTVINPFKVTQTGAYTFTMSTADKLEKAPDKRDIKVTQEGNTVDNAVKNAKLSEDKMSVEVTMEIPFVDQQKYNVEFGKEKDSFVASVGAPAAINIKTQSVVINKPTKIEYAVVDEKGMDVTKVVDSNKLSVEVTAKIGHYDAASKKLTLWKVGDTAEVKVTYHSWTYDAKTGKENVVEGKGTVTCVEKSFVTVTGLDKWTIADRVLSWDTDEMKNALPMKDNKKIWVRMQKSDFTYVDNKKEPGAFSFAPINTSTLYVSGTNTLYGTREGIEYVKVTYYDGTSKYEYTIPVTVGAESKAVALVLGQQYMSISKDSAANTYTTLKVIDQYKNELSNNTVKIEKLSGKDVAVFDTTETSKDGSIRKIGVKGIGAIGTGVYKITTTGTATPLSVTLTVNATDVSTAATGYQLKAEMNEFDATITEDTLPADLDNIASGMELTLYEIKAGLIDKKADIKSDVKSISINGREYNVSSTGMIDWKGGSNNTLVFKPVVKDHAGHYVVLGKAGSYIITVKAVVSGKEITVSDTIMIKNSTASPKLDESYSIGKYSKLNTSLLNFVNKVVVNKLNTGVLTNADKYATVLMNRSNAQFSTDNAGFTVFDFTTDKDFFLDTAALPSFKAGANTIWVVVDRLNKALSVEKTGLTAVADAENLTTNLLVYGNTRANKWELTATEDLGTVVPTIEKIYLKKDSTMADKKTDFTLAALPAFTGDHKSTLTITQKATTGAGVYVAVVKAKNGADIEAELTVEFEIKKKAAAAPTLSGALALDGPKKVITITFNEDVNAVDGTVELNFTAPVGLVGKKTGTVSQVTGQAKKIQVAFDVDLTNAEDETGADIFFNTPETDNILMGQFKGTLKTTAAETFTVAPIAER